MTQNQEKENNSNRENFQNAICYIPFVWVWLFFTQDKKSEELNKHIKYWTWLLVWFILLRFILIWLLGLNFLGWILFLIYAWVTWFFGYKAYSGSDVNIEYIDKFEETVKEKMK